MRHHAPRHPREDEDAAGIETRGEDPVDVSDRAPSCTHDDRRLGRDRSDRAKIATQRACSEKRVAARVVTFDPVDVALLFECVAAGFEMIEHGVELAIGEVPKRIRALQHAKYLVEPHRPERADAEHRLHRDVEIVTTQHERFDLAAIRATLEGHRREEVEHVERCDARDTHTARTVMTPSGRLREARHRSRGLQQDHLFGFGHVDPDFEAVGRDDRLECAVGEFSSNQRAFVGRHGAVKARDRNA